MWFFTQYGDKTIEKLNYFQFKQWLMKVSKVD